MLKNEKYKELNQMWFGVLLLLSKIATYIQYMFVNKVQALNIYYVTYIVLLLAATIGTLTKIRQFMRLTIYLLFVDIAYLLISTVYLFLRYPDTLSVMLVTLLIHGLLDLIVIIGLQNIIKKHEL